MMKPCRCSLGQLLLVALVGTAALFAHLADGYAWCQEYWNWDGKRHSKTDGMRWPANDGVVITYINGIFHSVPDWESITHQLQTIFGHEVRSFYNPSSGWWITDASKAGYHLLRKPANDTIAQALGEHLAQAVEDVGRGRVLHIAHSGGALITYLAAQHHLTKRQRDKIDVLTFGGARSITRKYFSGRVVNYYARNDPLVKLDRRAAELMKLTNNTKFQEINEKHNTTFVFLEGRAKQFVLDHSLEGPTYLHALKKEARAFRRAHFGPLSPLSWDYDQSMLRLARKKVAQFSGLRHFFNTDPLGLRLIRKGVARLTGRHGFFSGKITSSSLVVVDDKKGAAVGEGGGASEGSGWWSWLPIPGGLGKNGGKESDVVNTPPVAEDAPDGSGSSDRFWIGFRWPRRGSDKEDEGDSSGVSSAADGANLEGEPPLSSVVVAPRSRSLWARVQRGFWGLGRGKGFAPVDADAEAENIDVIDIPDSEESEEEDDVDEGAKEGTAEVRISSRPWLFSGWTPWAKRVESTFDDEPSPATTTADVDATAEAQVEPASTKQEEADGSDGGGDGERRDGGATHIVGSAGVGDEATGPPSVSREDLSSIRRWWFGSSASVTRTSAGESERDGSSRTDGGELDGREGEEKAGGGDADERAGGGSAGASPGETGDGEAGEGTTTATSGARAEGSPSASGLSEGEKQEEEQADTSPSLLRRWWPLPTSDSGGGDAEESAPPDASADSSEQQQQQQQPAEEATGVPPRLPPPVYSFAEEQQQQQQQPNAEDAAGAPPSDEDPEDQSQSQSPTSLLRRWWPTSKPERLEESTTSPPPTAEEGRGNDAETATASRTEEAEANAATGGAAEMDVYGVDGVPGLGDGRQPGGAITEESGRGHELPPAASGDALPELASEHQGQREDGKGRAGPTASEAAGTEAAATGAVDDVGGASPGQATTPRPPLVSRFWDVFTNRATDPEQVAPPSPPPPPIHDGASSASSKDAELPLQSSPETRSSASCDNRDGKSGDSRSPAASSSDVGSGGDSLAQGNQEGVPVGAEQAEGAGKAGMRDNKEGMGAGSLSESVGGEVFVSEGFLQIGQADEGAEGEGRGLLLPPPVKGGEGSPLSGADKEVEQRVDGETERRGSREAREEEEGRDEHEARRGNIDGEKEEMEELEWREKMMMEKEGDGNDAARGESRRVEEGDAGGGDNEEKVWEERDGEEGQAERDGVGAVGASGLVEAQEHTAPRGSKRAVKEERVGYDSHYDADRR